PTTVVRTVSHPTPTTVPPRTPVTKPSTTLAFTGFGPIGRVTAFLGVLLLLAGLTLYFVDVRRLSLWLLGRR
ncbi:MAG: hypothetical protein ABSG81_16325, partial [Acidimicrobiales bacterium]